MVVNWQAKLTLTNIVIVQAVMSRMDCNRLLDFGASGA